MANQRAYRHAVLTEPLGEVGGDPAGRANDEDGHEVAAASIAASSDEQRATRPGWTGCLVMTLPRGKPAAG